jgi:hypothetical protein
MESTTVVKDFMGIFPNVASKEYCDKVINRFDYLQEIQHEGRGKIWTRQEGENGISATLKDDCSYNLGGVAADHLPLKKEDVILMQQDMPLLQEFKAVVWQSYDRYAKKYGILTDVALHKMSFGVRIQKSKPSQGYHMWHCDSHDLMNCRRIVVVTLYLNTVEEGGETEFLYQQKRIPPTQGTLVLFPAGWTHTHRGNPPLKGNKYILTTWLEFTE